MCGARTHYKGFDQFGSVTFHLGAEPLVAALKDSPFELDYLPAHEAAEKFPFDMAGLDGYRAIILSDIGANSLLLPPDVWLQSRTVPNRLKLIKRLDGSRRRSADGRRLFLLPGHRRQGPLAAHAGGGRACR